MALSIKHTFISMKADGADATEVRPLNWNDTHKIETTVDGILLGRSVGAGGGPIQEVPMAALAEAVIPSGLIMPFAGSAVPTGWLFCDGKQFTALTYPKLAAAIGTTFGGTAANPRLPDLRGCVIAGRSDMGGTNRNNLTGGNAMNGTQLGAETKDGLVVEGNVEVSTDNGAEFHVEVDMGLLIPGKGASTLGGYIDNVNPASAGAGTGAGSSFATVRVLGAGGSPVIVNSGKTYGKGKMKGAIKDDGANVTADINVVQPTIVLNYVIKT